jgi:hypothetical protein
MTTGMVTVARFAASAEAVPQGVKIRSTLLRTSSSARVASRLGLPGSIAILECKRAPFDVTKVSQSPAKGVDAGSLTADETEHADAGRLASRLALREERRRNDGERESGRTQSPRHAHRLLSGRPLNITPSP